MTRTAYTARARRSGRWWAVEIPDVPGAFTQARRLDQVEAMAREAVALLLDAPGDSFDLTVEPDLASLGELGKVVVTARGERSKAADAANRSAAATREALARIRAAGMTARDAGALLGISVQRVSQIEARNRGA